MAVPKRQSLIWATFIAVILASSFVKGAIDFGGCMDDSADISIWEDHEPLVSKPVITVKANGNDKIEDFKLDIASAELKGILAYVEKSKTEIVVYLKESLKGKKEFYNSSVVIFSAKGAGPQTCKFKTKHVNLYKPSFTDIAQRTKVKENAVISTFFIATVRDMDLARGTEMNELFFSIKEENVQGQPEFTVTSAPNGTDTFSAKLEIKGTFDFEKEMFHQLTLQVTDKSENRVNPKPTPTHTTTETIVIEVEDVHDEPPKITMECGVKTFKEHTGIGQIAQVKAVDGDIQVKNIIQYAIIKDTDDRVEKYFKVDSASGEVSLKTSPDREDEDFLENTSVNFIIEAVEYKKGDPTKREDEPYQANSTCYFRITDIDDWPPEFNEETYEVTVDEHAAVDFPLPFGGPTEVTDKDEGENADFILSLSGDGSTLLDISLKNGQSKVAFSILVKDSEKLDYESLDFPNHKLELTVKAVGKLNPSHTDSATVIVNIRDMNDHPPVFSQTLYEVDLCENVQTGQEVLTVTATDKDSGDFGVDGIRYTILTNQNDFEIDTVTGIITVAENNLIDRERIEELYLIVQARDNLGQGQMASAEVHIHLEDYNDNAPIFLVTTFTAMLNENKDKMERETVLKALDGDKPDTNNSKVEYKLLKFTDFFSVDKSSGQISLNEPLDFEDKNPKFPDIFDRSSQVWKRNFVLEVQAYDLGEPQQVSKENAMVTIEFIDENDNVPVFKNTSLETSIEETIKLGTRLNVTLEASDDDLSLAYRNVNYRFYGEPPSSFLVDQKNGEIRVSLSPNLAPEVHNYVKYHNLTVEATDGLSNQDHKDMCIVHVEVIDVNNKDPKFNPVKNDTHEVVEEQEEAVLLGIFSAVDVDSNNELEFYLDYEKSRAEGPDRKRVYLKDYDFSKCFIINRTSGELTVLKVDREMVETIDLLVVVEDKNACCGQQIDTTTFSVTVLDINDNDPEFLHNNTWYGYQADIIEHRIDKQLLKLDAIDKDLHNVITFSLQMNTNITDDIVAIDPQKGVIRFGPVDYEEYHEVNFTVIATDSDPSGNRSSTATVVVYIEDINDNKPEFQTNVSYEATIKENSPNGAFVFFLNATDKDSGDFGVVHYRLDMDHKHAKYFQIPNPEVGIVEINKPPNFEEIEQLTPTIEAFDNPNSSSNSLHNVKTLTVTILDENDNAPIFIPHDKCMTISEDAPVGKEIGRVIAVDKDQLGTNNSFVEYHILAGNEKDYFRLGLETGEFKVNQILLDVPVVGSNPNFTLLLMAKDRGDIPLNSTMEFCIFVVDINNNFPIFTKPDTRPHDMAVFENTLTNPVKGITLYTVLAEDKDWDEFNHNVIYSIQRIYGRKKDEQDAVEFKNHFTVDPRTGTIVINHDLKKAEASEYEISVRACDSSLDNKKCTSDDCSGNECSHDAVLIVHVKGDVDRLPKFQNGSEILMFTEHSELGKEVQYIPEAAYDKAVENAASLPICYHLIGGDQELFSLNTSDRSLVVIKELDREEHRYHSIMVQTSNCSHVSNITNFNQMRDDVLNITIKVIDINDQKPIFIQEIFTAGISSSEVTLNLKLKTQLSATDADEGENAVVEYLMMGEVNRNGNYLEGLPKQLFHVDNDTGEMYVLFSADKLMEGHFSFKVMARDKGGLYSTAEVRIYLMSEAQQILLHVGIQYTKINPTVLQDFSNMVSGVIKYKFNVDKYEVYIGPKLELRETSTTFWAHVVDPKTNLVLAPKDALNIVNLHIHELTKQAIKLGAPLIGAEEKVVQKQEHEKDYKMILLITSIGILMLALVVTCGIFCFKVSSSKRKLKAATAGTYGNEDTKVDLSLPVAPNTNAHAGLGSNPIWNEDEGPDDIKMPPIIPYNNSFDTTSNLSGLDTLVMDSTNNPLFVNDDEDDILDGAMNAGLDVSEDEAENEYATDNAIYTMQTEVAPKKVDTISNLKRAEQKWREAKNAKGPAPKPPTGFYQLQPDRKRKDYIPGVEDESNL